MSTRYQSFALHGPDQALQIHVQSSYDKCSSPDPIPNLPFHLTSKESNDHDVIKTADDFPNPLKHSTIDSDADSEADDESSSSTTEEIGTSVGYGYPLERWKRCDHIPRGEELAYTRSNSISSTSSLIDYESLIDAFLATPANLHNLIPYKSPSCISCINPRPLMIQRLPTSSPETSLLLQLNHSGLRSDPWNPVPQVHHSTQRGEDTFLIVDRLHSFNNPRMQNVAQYLDFFRQMFEGLTFLHEQCVAGFSCADPTSYMMDVSSAVPMTPSVCSPPFSPGLDQVPDPLEEIIERALGDIEGIPVSFDRGLHPVRYYFVNFENTELFEGKANGEIKALSGSRSSTLLDMQLQDVRDYGILITQLLSEVPPISPIITPLVETMIGTGMTADAARVQFDSLCHQMDPRIFEVPLTQRGTS